MKGIERFETYLDQLVQLTQGISKSKSAAESMLQQNGRTIFFMLEGLCRVYQFLHNKKLFSKLGEKVKAVEDLLGDMDHYRECIDEFDKKDNIPAPVIEYFREMYGKSTGKLNLLLQKEGWLNGSRIEKIRKKLHKASWKKEKKEAEEIKRYYQEEIKEFEKLCKETGRMTEIEDHLHEFRRRLRWFSIYPHALQGIIQLEENKKNRENLLKYQTAEIVSSPFNKLPEVGNARFICYLRKENFLALSWMIDALGKLKDRGLLSENLVHALKETRQSSDFLNALEPPGDLLKEANNIMQAFMEDKVLDDLVGKISKKGRP